MDNNQYPKTIMAALDILVNHKHDARPNGQKQQGNPKRDDEGGDK